MAKFGGIEHLREQCERDLAVLGTLATDMKRYDPMNQINARGTYSGLENLGKSCI